MGWVVSGVVAKGGTNHSNYLLSKYREVMKINVVVVAISHAFKKNIGNIFSLLFFPRCVLTVLFITSTLFSYFPVLSVVLCMKCSLSTACLNEDNSA